MPLLSTTRTKSLLFVLGLLAVILAIFLEIRMNGSWKAFSSAALSFSRRPYTEPTINVLGVPSSINMTAKRTPVYFLSHGGYEVRHNCDSNA